MSSTHEQLLSTIPLGEQPLPLQSYLDFVSLSLDDLKGKTVLDLGSGINRAFAAQANLAGNTKVVSLEPRAAFEQAIPHNDLAPLVAGMAYKLPFRNDSFDLAVSFTAIPMWLKTEDEMRDSFQEIDRVLKPGGEARLYPPFHQIFWEDYQQGRIAFTPETQFKSTGSKTSHITLAGLQNLGIENLSIVKRDMVSQRELFSQPEYLLYKKPSTHTLDKQHDFRKIVSASTQRRSHVVECKDSAAGEAFFSPLKQAKLTGLSILRYPTHDLIAFLIDDNEKAMAIAVEKGTFIAVELHDYKNPEHRANLAFRDDISHRRLNLALSFASGQDVTYLDPKTAKGEIFPVDPAAQFAQFVFDKEAVIQSVKPTWYTEDWITVRLADDRSIVIRADRMKLIGAMLVNKNGIDYMNIRGDVTGIKLGNPEEKPPTVKFLPNPSK
ncbi:MAG: hypothetical protein A3D74_03500 [Candidatus Levybacteria bacterium RIFCSPHIGHO2_02_FULL_37_13]|nr:MAG: hypothetical protein A3D74_03500 [Candidatus Levybacteria bacterium RIFCSPHIGHO2_02_FULL_37_13]OGH40222.1 MAG: hypothetical protein A3B41_04510 [Candidatus Levybacteria bacterium RIFCSPLOWO2_01_FULL_37_26]